MTKPEDSSTYPHARTETEQTVPEPTIPDTEET